MLTQKINGLAVFWYTKYMRKIRILLTGGGTGGHIYPLIAVKEKLVDISNRHSFEADIRFMGSAGKWKTVLEGYGLRVYRVAGSKMRRYFSPLNFLEPFIFVYSLFQALFKVYFYMPDVVFSKSGPGSLAVVLAAFFYRIPVMIHESDSYPGLSNKIAANFSKSIALGFKESSSYFKNKNIQVTGNPVRDDLLNNRDPQELAKRFFGFKPEKKVILVIGGSQGAQSINDFIISISPELLKKYQILHQTGVENFNESRGELEFVTEGLEDEYKKGYKMVAYFNKDLKEAYSAADLIISRAGAGSIFEIASFSKPAILIPLKGHQRYNAYSFAEAGAGKIIEQDNLLPSVFLVQVDKILEHEDVIESMKQASQDFFIPNSSQMIAEEIIRLTL